MSLVPYSAKRAREDSSSDEESLVSSGDSLMEGSSDSLSDSMSDESEDDSFGARPRAERQIVQGRRVHKSQDGQFSVVAPRVRSVEEAAKHGIRLTAKDLNTGGVKGGTPIGVAREIGIQNKRLRTKMLKDLKNGDVKLSDILRMATDTKDPNIVIAGKIRLKILLQHLPGVGKGKVQTILVLSQIDPSMTMRQLCMPQNRDVLHRLINVMINNVESLKRQGVLGFSIKRE